MDSTPPPRSRRPWLRRLLLRSRESDWRTVALLNVFVLSFLAFPLATEGCTSISSVIPETAWTRGCREQLSRQTRHTLPTLDLS